MRLILPSCRASLTAADLLLICSILSPDQTETGALERFLTDPESRDELLDSDALFHYLMEQADPLSVSPRLYFYVMARRALKRASLDDRETADYIASMLAGQVEQSNHSHPFVSPGGRRSAFFYAVDAFQHIAAAAPTERFFLIVDLANISLFVTGIYPGHIEHRARYRGAPSIDYYEQIGQTQFRAACDHRLASEFQLQDIFERLGGEFHRARCALNHLGETLLFTGQVPPPPELPQN